ncbi:MAG: MASE1 domain-containing protein, partial [Methylobacter sp.]|nr:MASE1 domain-containing protein [Methylobacter sp.]
MSQLLKPLGLAAIYALLGWLVYACCSGNAVISIIWLPAGLALSALLLGGNRYAGGVFVGAFLLNMIMLGSFAVAVSIALGNTLEALLAVWLLKRSGAFG